MTLRRNGIAARLFDEEVLVEEMDPNDAADAGEALFSEEEAAIARAVDKRRREYTAGRLCARRALAKLDVEAFALLNDEERAPIWPEGIVGSISHTHTWCSVVAARAGEIRSLGVDVERDRPLKENLRDAVLNPDELAWLEEQPEERRGTLGMVIFSAKECAYKCQYPLSRAFLGFHAMSVSLDPTRGLYRATFRRDAAGAFREGDSLEGRYLRDAGLIVTAMTLRS